MQRQTLCQDELQTSPVGNHQFGALLRPRAKLTVFVLMNLVAGLLANQCFARVQHGG